MTLVSARTPGLAAVLFAASAVSALAQGMPGPGGPWGGGPWGGGPQGGWQGSDGGGYEQRIGQPQTEPPSMKNGVPAFHVNVGTRGSQVAVQIDHEHVHGKL